MKELYEIQSKLKEMKKDKEQQKQFMEALKNEKGMLSEKNKVIAEKLKEATNAYSEAGRRLTEFVDTQIKPMKKKLDDFDSNLTEIRGHQKALIDGLGRVDNFEKVLGGIKAAVFNVEKNQARFESLLKDMSKRDDELLGRIIQIESGKEDTESVNNKLKETHKGLAETLKEMKDFITETRKTTNDELNRMKAEVGKGISLIQTDVEKKDSKNERYINKLVSDVHVSLDEKLKEMSSVQESRSRDIEEKLVETGDRFGKIIERIKSGMSKAEETENQKLDITYKKMEKELKLAAKEMAEELGGKISSVREDLNTTKKFIETLSGAIGKKIQESDDARKGEVDKVVKEFLVVKGQAEESLREIGKE
ncbi:MAG: hypothetical protein JW754_02425, partial [Candidatus Aenigmarchaeota archaeon]|nr:hypothetical protein [Candidatus Aenigmarchaeota archaeon]